MKGIKLEAINNLLRRVGLVLVVAIDRREDAPTRLWIEHSRAFDARCSGLPVPDPWLGVDKAKHAAGCAAIMLATASVLSVFKVPHAVLAGAAAGGAVGVSKEAWDLLSGRGTPSWRDLAADAVGIAVGAAVALALLEVLP